MTGLLSNCQAPNVVGVTNSSEFPQFTNCFSQDSFIDRPNSRSIHPLHMHQHTSIATYPHLYQPGILPPPQPLLDPASHPLSTITSTIANANLTWFHVSGASNHLTRSTSNLPHSSHYFGTSEILVGNDNDISFLHVRSSSIPRKFIHVILCNCTS